MDNVFAFPPDPLAPWGEVLPAVEVITANHQARQPDEGCTYELVQGRLVRLPLGGGEASKVALRLGAGLLAYVEEHGLGVVTGADGTYDLGAAGLPDTQLAPGAAFVRAGRAPEPGTPAYGRAWPLAPDLVVEVAAPHHYRPELGAKACLYLQAGTRLVWVVWPRYREVDVWHPGGSAPSATLTTGDWLVGEDVVAGFTYSVARLFA